jgi:ATP-dependent phosphoenolpyruvate carboxykinase
MEGLLKAVIDGGIGAAFIMLHLSKYAAMLADKMKRHGATAWLVNTGWSGGRYMRDSTWSLLKNLVKEVPGCLLVILLHPCNIVCCEMLHA